MNLGILNLSEHLQSLHYEKLYAISCESRKMAVNMGLHALFQNREEFNLKYLILDDISQDDIRNDFASPQRLSEIRGHVYSNRNHGHFLKWLPSDLRRVNAMDDNCLFVVILRDALYKDTRSFNLRQTIASLKTFAAINHSTIVLINYGFNHLEVNSLLLAHSSELDGIMSVSASGSSYALNVFLWKADTGEISQGQSELALKPNGFVSIDNNSEDDFIGDDYHDCYVPAGDFKPDRTLFNRIITFENNQRLYEHALKYAVSGTCFFTIASRDDIEPLSKMIYTLREHKGRQLRIFIIDRSNGIRASSARILFDCGANFIFDRDAKNAYINTALFSLKDLFFKNEVNTDYNAIMNRYTRVEREKNGYLEKDDFIRKVTDLLSSDSEYDCDGALAVLKPQEYLPVESTVGQFKPKRGGDYCTIDAGSCIIFLPSCRSGDLSIGLKHVFNTDYEKLFKKCSAAYTKPEIIAMLHTIKTNRKMDDINFRQIEMIKEENDFRARDLSAEDIRDFCMHTSWEPQECDIKELL